MKILLGSASPRRAEILNYFNLDFEQIPSDFDEESVPFENDPKAYALTLAEKKAEVLARKFFNSLIITADTVVYFNGKIYNKPKNPEEAFMFMSELSGQWHHVFTAVAVQKGKTLDSDIEETKILMNTLTPSQITTYHSHCFFQDKAGGYAIQKAGGLIIRRIEGCYDNVMGFPINTVQRLLLKMGIDLWNFLKPF